jgi:tRNA (cmo5U34)-methyltransferase
MPVEVSTGKHFPANPKLFEFDGEVASIFDDMAVRSIPGYLACHDMIGRLVSTTLHPGAKILNLGCSTGNAFLAIERYAPGAYEFIGVDQSRPMLDKTLEKTTAKTLAIDLTDDMTSFDAMCGGRPGAVVIGWTLQFMKSRPRRAQLIAEAYRSLAPGGFLVVMEKYRLSSPPLETVAAGAYYQFRMDNGYTPEEYAAKTKALKNAMWPATPNETRKDMWQAGFSHIEVLYRQFNFGAFVAFKDV